MSNCETVFKVEEFSVPDFEGDGAAAVAWAGELFNGLRIKNGDVQIALNICWTATCETIECSVGKCKWNKRAMGRQKPKGCFTVWVTLKDVALPGILSEACIKAIADCDFPNLPGEAIAEVACILISDDVKKECPKESAKPEEVIDIEKIQDEIDKAAESISASWLKCQCGGQFNGVGSVAVEVHNVNNGFKSYFDEKIKRSMSN